LKPNSDHELPLGSIIRLGEKLQNKPSMLIASGEDVAYLIIRVNVAARHGVQIPAKWMK
jgi:hypothetical protein